MPNNRGKTRKDKPCEMCGVMLFNVAAHHRFCKSCLRERERDRDRKKRGCAPILKRPARMSPAMSVAEVAAAAKAAGVSYGQYVLQMQRGEKP